MQWEKNYSFLAFSFTSTGIPSIIGYASLAFFEINSFFFESHCSGFLETGQIIKSSRALSKFNILIDCFMIDISIK